MPRQARVAPGGLIYHVLNRGTGRIPLFETPADYAAFLRVFAEVLAVEPMRVCGFCVMGNHWHLVLWPDEDGQLARFMHRLTVTHVRRWVEHRHRVGWGNVYQGRYKSFVVQDDEHFLTLMRYVERNPLRANLVEAAEAWPWSSLSRHAAGGRADGGPMIPLCDWPVARPADWVEWVNRPQTAAEENALRRCLRQDRPLGDQGWTTDMEARLGLTPYRPRGRPRYEAR